MAGNGNFWLFLAGEGDKILKNLCCTYYVLMDVYYEVASNSLKFLRNMLNIQALGKPWLL